MSREQTIFSLPNISEKTRTHMWLCNINLGTLHGFCRRLASPTNHPTTILYGTGTILIQVEISILASARLQKIIILKDNFGSSSSGSATLKHQVHTVLAVYINIYKNFYFILNFKIRVKMKICRFDVQAKSQDSRITVLLKI